MFKSVLCKNKKPSKKAIEKIFLISYGKNFDDN